MILTPSVNDAVKGIWPGSDNVWAPPALSGLGDDSTWTDIVNALPALANTGVQVYSAIKTQDAVAAMAQRGIMPIGYQNGLPVYRSTPAGVTPSNPFSLPSGLRLPVGVTPSYYGYPSVYGQDYYDQQPSIFGDNPYTPLLLVGGGILLLALLMR